MANFVLVYLLTASGVTHFITVGGNFDSVMKTDDIVFFVVLPTSVFLFVVAVQGSSGIVVREPEIDSNSRPQVNETSLINPNVSGYATASWFSKVTWHWMGPLLSKG